MPSSTTSITLSSLLDLIGPTAQPPTSGKDQRAFDALLQPAPVSPSSPPPEACNCPPPPRPTQRRDQDQSSSRNESERPDTSSTTTHPESAEPQATADDDGAVATTEARTTPSDTATTEDKSLEAEQVVAESLAGLVAVVPTTTATQPTLTEATAGDTSSIDEIEPAAAPPKNSGGVEARVPLPAIQPVQATLAIDPQPVSAKEDDAAAETSSANAANESENKSKAEAAGPVSSATFLIAIADGNAANGAETANQSEQLDATNATPSETEHKPDDSRRGSQALPDDQTAVANTSANDRSAPTQNTSAPPVVAIPVLPSGAPEQSANAAAPSTSTSAMGGVNPGRSRLPAELLAPRAAGSKPAPLEVDTTRLLHRVARAFSAAQERDGEVRLRLSPPELGSLRLDVRVQDGALVAHLQTETDAARTAILDNLPALRDRLAEQGVRIERFDVDLMQRQPGGMPDQPGGRQPEPQPPSQRLFLPQRAAAVAPTTPAPSSLLGGSTDGLNVIV